ncbi:hypothetical protein PF010_g25482 [Phytophthora fragariae]|uniref:Uncharacterized protein n=1 Tax=Phytophthora fragariae TaxID=53985 RepID=A0A6G0JZQ2_9STRA|nr:hypothetical protein PF010_g25482 [Phytophthora fragariae]
MQISALHLTALLFLRDTCIHLILQLIFKLAKRRRYAAVVFISWRRPLRHWRTPFRSPRRLAAQLAVLCW